MRDPLRAISSMATKAVLAELAAESAVHTGYALSIESVGGVDAAKRVKAGEQFDIVFLASDAVDKLMDAGQLLRGSKVNLMRSGVEVCVRKGAKRPDISTETALLAAVRAAHSISVSTGPSGVALEQLFERWGISEEIASRKVQAPPGVPVGSLVASGEVELGFQQKSELMHLAGIDMLGPLPPAIQIVTTFSAGIGVGSLHPEAAAAVLGYMASANASPAKLRQGMEPV